MRAIDRASKLLEQVYQVLFALKKVYQIPISSQMNLWCM
jgi:hypothetical protein